MTNPATAQIEMKLELKYRGAEVDRGRMDAIELGPAILGLAKVIAETSRILYGDQTRVRVEVRADFRHASFGVEFYAIAVDGGLIGGLTLSQLSAISAILGIGGITGAVKGIIWLARLIKNKRVVKAEREGDQVHISIEGNSAPVTVTINEYRVFSDSEVRKGLRAVTDPLQREGIDSVEISADTREPDLLPAIIEKNDADLFEATVIPEEDVSTDTSKAVLEVISPVFRPGNKWKFGQGDVTFWAEVADKDFLAKVSKRSDVFGQGDALYVELQVRTTRLEGELDFKRRITKVLEHYPGRQGHQLDLS